MSTQTHSTVTETASEPTDFIKQAQRVLQIEADAILALQNQLDQHFSKACLLIQQTLQQGGRLVVMGMGKSGHIGHKMAATFASTGTPAFFVHPAEASHGDLGMIADKDVVLAISNSGETAEITLLLPILKRQGTALICMTGVAHSTLAKQADVHLWVAVAQEACPLNLAPTASTTAMLALGDALAVSLLHASGFQPEDFARSHPGGKLGKKLLTYVSDIMRTDEKLPISQPNDSVIDAIMQISAKNIGLTVVLNDAKRVVGVFSDGDLRRLLERQTRDQSLANISLLEVMTQTPTCIASTQLADVALALMEKKKIAAIPVVDSNQHLLGVVSMHDLLQAGLV